MYGGTADPVNRGPFDSVDRDASVLIYPRQRVAELGVGIRVGGEFTTVGGISTGERPA